MKKEFKSLSDEYYWDQRYKFRYWKEKDIKEFIKLICEKIHCGWRVDAIKELAGDKLTKS